MTAHLRTARLDTLGLDIIIEIPVVSAEHHILDAAYKALHSNVAGEVMHAGVVTSHTDCFVYIQISVTAG